MTRIRADYVFGTTTASLTASDTTLSSAELSRLPAVASPDIAAVTLTDGTNYEVVHVTAHTAGASTAIIARGQEGSTARSWASGATWDHGATAEDFTQQAVETLFDPTAGRSPHLAPYGVKLRGANIVPQEASGNGWATLYANWATKWDAVVKPQIDAVASVGANAIRLIGDVGGVHTGALTLDAYVAAYEQFVDYCANLGLYVYACLSDATHWDGATKDQALEVMRAQATMLETKPNVIGIDVVQELGLYPTIWSGSTEHDFVSYLFTSLRTVTTLPLTCSNLGSDNTTSSMWNTTTTAAFDDLVDFYDFHPYYDGMVSADLDPYFAATTKPVIIGEYGADVSKPARYSAAAAVSARSGVLGSFVWAAADNGTTAAGQGGLFDFTFNERTTLTTYFRTVPVRERFADGGRVILGNSSIVPTRGKLNFVGAGVAVADDAANDATTVTIAGGGGGGTTTMSHAEYTSSFTSVVGSNNVGTPIVDSGKSTDTTFVTPATDGTFTVAASGVYHAHAIYTLAGVSWSGTPRVMANIFANGVAVARESLNTTSNEDTFNVSAPGFYVGAGQTIQFTYYRGSGTGSVSVRFFLTKIG